MPDDVCIYDDRITGTTHRGAVMHSPLPMTETQLRLGAASQRNRLFRAQGTSGSIGAAADIGPVRRKFAYARIRVGGRATPEKNTHSAANSGGGTSVRIMRPRAHPSNYACMRAR